MSSRRSLGGRSLSALRDGSARQNAIAGRRRESVGSKDEETTPQKHIRRGLLDSRGMYSAPRRTSHGGNNLQGESPIRDRRAMLEAWRQERAGTRGEEDGNGERKKRTRVDPLLPPSGANKTSRTTTQYSQESEDHISFSQQSPSRHSIMYYDDESENQCRNGGGILASRTPLSKKRRGLGSARRHSLLGRNISRSEEFSQDDPLSQLSGDNETDAIKPDNLDMVEDVGFVSQIERMTQRIEQLEKEKMDLSMSKAPLEARFRQKEDNWQKERARLCQEIESSKTALRESDEKYRDLQVQYDQRYDECTRLRLEVRKASSSHQPNADSSMWSRHLQNDRDLTEMKEKLRAAEDDINSIRLTKVSLEKELHATRIELTALTRNYEELKEEYDEIAAHTSENKEAEIKLEVLTEEHIATTAALNAVYADLDVTKARAEAAMKESEDAHRKEIEQLHFDLSVMKTRASKIQVDIDSSLIQECEEEDEAVLRARIEERDKRIAELENQVLSGEQMRRQMHNMIQELRGNIRVYVRTRPFLPGDQQTNESPVEVSPDGESLSIVDRRSGSPMDFKFDKVFPQSAGQELVFDEVSDFVQSALDGYHVCLFSYGQTGSGKTHTMQGCGKGPMKGIIPRAVEQILCQARALTAQKWDFNITASFLEIYNENLNDLLVSMKPGAKKNSKLTIKRNRSGKSFVDGLAEIPIDTRDCATGMGQLDALMGVAARARSVASTKMNSQSSRSHSVFMLHLNGHNEETGAVVSGALNLCDLAGSERLDRSGAGADATRLKETQAINKSLSCLGDVFNALATGASHVPYRNSKLTYLLQDCLSGDGKALMFVNLSPTTASSGESLCSLRFAQRVNQVELGKATKNIEYSGRSKR